MLNYLGFILQVSLCDNHLKKKKQRHLPVELETLLRDCVISKHAVYGDNSKKCGLKCMHIFCIYKHPRVHHFKNNFKKKSGKF